MSDENYPFMGTFDGQGYTISGLKIQKEHDSLDAQGFFGLAWKSTIQNVKFDGVTVDAKPANTSTNYVGVLSGYMYASTVINVTVSNVEADLERTGFGIIAGYMYACTRYDKEDNRMNVKDVIVQNVDAKIKTAGYVAGMAGYMHLNYESDYSKCPVNRFENVDIYGFNVESFSAPANQRIIITGLVGWQQGRGILNLVGCDTDMDVKVSGDCDYMIAGAVNNAYNPLFENCTTKGTIVDHGSAERTVIGGFTNGLRRANASGGMIKNCKSDMDIQSNNGTVGGFLSMQSCDANNTVFNIENCKATGDVSGRIAGGFIGKVYGAQLSNKMPPEPETTPISFTLNVKNSKASGDVRGREISSGFIGIAQGLKNGSTDKKVTINITNSGSSSDVFGTEFVNGVLASVDDLCVVQPVYPDANWWFTGRINPVDVVPELPQTGDQSRMTLWMLLCAVSVVGMSVLGKRRAGINVKR